MGQNSDPLNFMFESEKLRLRFRNDVGAGRDVRWRRLGETNNYRVTGNTPRKPPTSKGHRETGRQADIQVDRQVDRQITAVELFPEIKQYWLIL